MGILLHTRLVHPKARDRHQKRAQYFFEEAALLLNFLLMAMLTNVIRNVVRFQILRQARKERIRNRQDHIWKLLVNGGLLLATGALEEPRYSSLEISFVELKIFFAASRIEVNAVNQLLVELVCVALLWQVLDQVLRNQQRPRLNHLLCHHLHLR